LDSKAGRRIATSPEASEPGRGDERRPPEAAETPAPGEPCLASQEAALARLRAIQYVSDAALSSLDLDVLLHELLMRIREVLAADTATILLLSEDESCLIVRASVGLQEDIWKQVQVPFGRGVAGRIAASRQPLVIDDLSTVEVVSPVLRANIHSLMGVPLVVQDRLIGVAHVDTIRPHHFTADEVRLLQLVADRAALAIENARLYATANRAREQAEEALHARDQFLSAAAHELRTPVTNLRGFAQLVLRRLDKEGALDPQQVRRALQVIDQEAERLARLVTQLLDITRLDTGQLRLERRQVDLAELVREWVARAQASTRRHKLNLQAPPSMPAIVDPVRIEEVVSNLLANAIRFSPDDLPIDIQVSTPDPDTVRIAVRDYGPGIPPERRGQLFSRFYQVQGVEPFGGLGLGLYLGGQLVQLHGGNIKAEFPAEGGSVFTVTLPRGLEPAEQSGGRRDEVKSTNSDHR